MTKRIIVTMLVLAAFGSAWADWALNEQFDDPAGTAPSSSVWNLSKNKGAGTETIIAETTGSGTLEFGAENMSSTYSTMYMETVAKYARSGATDSLVVEMKYQFPNNIGRDYFSLWLTPNAGGAASNNGIQYQISGFNAAGPGQSNCIQWVNNSSIWQYQVHSGPVGLLAADEWHWFRMELYYDQGQSTDRIRFSFSNDGVNWTVPTVPGVNAALQADEYYVTLAWQGKTNLTGTTSYNFIDYVVATPEPTTMALVCIGGIFALRRRKK